jgi:ABC-2 type transport system permease protein
MPARNLLAGKIAGIGLLGLAQIVLTALVALVVVASMHSIHVPAVRGSVLAWAVAWFVLGYILYATIFGALGSLASRPEDAQAVTGPVSVIMIASFFVSFAAIGSPATIWAKLVSYFPLTAPLAMPNRIAMGAAAFWEPLLAAAFTVASIVGLVYVGGRVYTGAILHAGPTLSLRDAWNSLTAEARVESPVGIATATKWPVRTPGRGERKKIVASTNQPNRPVFTTVLLVAGVGLGILVAVLTKDVIVGVIVGAVLVGVVTQLAKLWSGQSGRHPRHL